MSERHEVVKARLDAAETSQVRALIDAAQQADGVAPVGEHVLLGLRYGDADSRNILLYADGVTVGYGYLSTASAGADSGGTVSGEMVVHPRYRGRGHGRALARLMCATAEGRLRLWAHGRHPHAERLAADLGFDRVRSLWQMRRSLHVPIPEAELPADVELRAFRPGSDEPDWIALNHLAFSWHSEQGGMTVDDLRRREDEPWFDPKGFLIAERAGRMIGFHWTKVHEATAEHDPIGEVYVVGVHPDERGAGLGRALTLAGIRYLRGRGLDRVMLYVDETNPPAIRLYEALGFSRWDTDVMYQCGSGAG